MDRQGQRTLTVLTKLDLRQSHDPIEAPSSGLGFVCLRNRTDEEQKSGTTFEQAKVIEADFFKTRPELMSLKPSQKGIDALMDRLVSL